MKKLLTALPVAAALLCASLGAASADDATSIQYFTAENVSALLTKWGAAKVTQGKMKSGETKIEFDVQGVTHTAILLACPQGKPGCLGLYLGVPVAIKDGKAPAEAINGFNDALPFGKAVRVDDGSVVVLFRYVISDGGISEENLNVNVAVFTQTPEILAKYLSSVNIVASLPTKAPTAQLGYSTPATTSAHAPSGTSWLQNAANEIAYRRPR